MGSMTKYELLFKSKVSELVMPKDYSLYKDGLTQSLVSVFLECRRKFLLVLHLLSSGGTTEAIRRGSMWHWFMAKLYRYNKPAGVDQIMNWTEEFVKGSSPERYDYKGYEQDMMRDTAICAVLLEPYGKGYADDFRNKYFMVEKIISCEFCMPGMGELEKNNTITLRGKIDGAFLTLIRAIRLLEHKMRSRIDIEGLIDYLSIDLQVLWYIYLLNEYIYENSDLAQRYKFKDAYVSGCSYNIVRYPQLKLGKSEKLKEYIDRVIEDVMSRPDFYYIRHELVFTEKDIDSFVSGRLTEILFDIRDTCEIGKNEPSVFYMNTNACSGKFGTCQFLETCSRDRIVNQKCCEYLFPELLYKKGDYRNEHAGRKIWSR